MVSDRLDVLGLRVAVDDYVFRGESLGLVLACCCEGEDLYVVVDALRKISDLSPHANLWCTTAAERQVWIATDVAECLAWQLVPPNGVVAIRM